MSRNPSPPRISTSSTIPPARIGIVESFEPPEVEPEPAAGSGVAVAPGAPVTPATRTAGWAVTTAVGEAAATAAGVGVEVGVPVAVGVAVSVDVGVGVRAIAGVGVAVGLCVGP
jgi:hypothetical protein